MNRILAKTGFRTAVMLAALTSAGTGFAQAPDAAFSPAYRSCMERSGGVTLGMVECGSAEYKKLDGALNDAYRQAMASLSDDQKGLLRETQRAWLAYRDSTCSFMSRLGDRGTLARVSDLSCLLRTTSERTQWLKDLLQP